MADIATIFHWAPADMDAMSPAELSDWWHRALARVPGGGDGDG